MNASFSVSPGSRTQNSSPDPEHRVAAAGSPPQRIGHQAQGPVTDLVAVEVVDLLEVVDVEHEHAEGPAGGELSGQLLVKDAMAEQPGQRVVASVILALLVEQRLVDRQLAQADEVQQHLVGLGADRRRAGDRHDADGSAGALERESLPSVVERGRPTSLDGPVGVLAGAGENRPVTGAVEEDEAGPDPRLGNHRIGNLPPDLVELEHAGEHGRQLVQTMKLAQLDLHPFVEQAVLDGEGDAIRDGAQLGCLGLLEGIVAAPRQQQQPERAIADEQPSPGDVAGGVGHKPRGHRQLLHRTDAY